VNNLLLEALIADRGVEIDRELRQIRLTRQVAQAESDVARQFGAARAGLGRWLMRSGEAVAGKANASVQSTPCACPA
jgi:hypothetical protein